MPQECVTVAVRCRPMNLKEIDEGRKCAVQIDTAAKQVTIGPVKPGEAPKSYTFDMVFDPEATQLDVYNQCAKKLVDSVIQGYNGTGKTHTMEGDNTDAGKGIIPRTFEQIFNTIDWSTNKQFLVRASFLEVYNEDIRDLLSKNPKNKLELHEARDGYVYVKGLNTFLVKSIQEISSILEVGKKNRSVGATMMNQDSSRSHSVFTITIEVADPQQNGEKSCIRVGKLNLVDLAGSERQSKTGAAGDRFKEAAKINLSLSSLGNVISALVDGKSGHIPYRDSKLTRLLQDSLGGNTKTVMIANCGPADYNYDESLSALRYANRAKNIRNKPRINEDPKDAMLREFQAEIARLKAALASDEDISVVPFGLESREANQEITQLSKDEVEVMRQQIEDELHLEYSSSGAVLDRDALAKVQAEVEIQLAAQIENIQKEHERAAQEAAKLAQTLEQQAEEVIKVQAKREEAKARNDQLAEKLMLLESKLLQGDQIGGLDQLAMNKETCVRKQKDELKRQKEQEAIKAEQIAKLEATTQSVEKRFNCMQEEADVKTRKLHEAWRQYQMAREEAADYFAEFQEERDELVSNIRELHHNLALKNLVIDAFIPQEEVQKIMRRASYQEVQGTWNLNRQQLNTTTYNTSTRRRPMSAAGLRRPTSNYSRIASASGTSSLRFKPENILVLELDMPERTTFDYDAAADEGRIQAILDSSTPPRPLQPGNLPLWSLAVHV